MRNDVGAEIEVDDSDKGCRDDVWLQQLLEADTSCQHGDNLGIACQLRREENDGDEDKQGREEVGEIGHEIGVIIEDNSLPGGAVGRELRQVLVEVEDDGHGDDEDDGEDIRADKLLHQITVQTR